MVLKIIGSSSSGNSYLLEDNKGRQLCIEAGRPIKEVKKAGLKTAKCEGVIISHSHSDHSKYLNDFVCAGIDVYATQEIEDKYIGVKGLAAGRTYHMGDYSVTPMCVDHDVPCFSYLIHHPEFGTLWFFTDCYNMKSIVKGVTYVMCECNYEDALLQKAVDEKRISMNQADRIRLSHMSLAHGIELMRKCDADKTCKKIILIHGSSRHLYPEVAIGKFQQCLGVPTYYARTNLTIDL